MRTFISFIFLVWATTIVAQEAGPIGPQGRAGEDRVIGGVGQPSGSTPVPDPTKLTQEAVDRTKAQIVELFKVQLDALTARFDRLQEAVDARPDSVNKTVLEAIGNLQTLMNEKFKGVDQQFAGRDVALAAALLAQESKVDEQNKSNAASISKSDAATAKQIETIAANIDSKTNAINEKVDDLRNRLQSIESRALGANDTTSSIWGYIFGAIGAVGAMFGVWALSQHTPSRTGAK